ncbi:MAG: antibiotic biosynthesis monooxygenase [Labilithrix sp.]|nr:antibiotic biosynthesis monooxygenase [Labilithrix sp.]
MSDAGAPCFAVIFSSQRAPASDDGYEDVASAMLELAKTQPGFLGFESARNPDGSGITVSYWDSLEAIARFRAEPEHRKAQERGKDGFYTRYDVRVCNVVRGYSFPRPR